MKKEFLIFQFYNNYQAKDVSVYNLKDFEQLLQFLILFYFYITSTSFISFSNSFVGRIL